MNCQNAHYLFSENIALFIKRLQKHAIAILRNDMGLSAQVKRFIFQGYSYPLQIVCFDHPSRLGQFDPEMLEIALHKDLLLDESLAIDVLKHELAHYIAYLEFGCLDHGAQFHEVCKRYHFPKEIARATSKAQKPSLPELQKRIQKLLNLSKSTSQHEAEAALLKAEELMAKHSLSPSFDEEYIALNRTLKQKRTSQKQKTIGQMLRHFHVEVIFHHGQKTTYVEIIGSKHHVEIASYIADFLNEELEILWKKAQKEHALKGMSAKNSFLRGIAHGYDQKKRHPCEEKGLIKANLARGLSLVYPHLRRSYSKHKHDKNSHSIGEATGKKLQLRSGIGKKMSDLLRVSYEPSS